MRFKQAGVFGEDRLSRLDIWHTERRRGANQELLSQGAESFRSCVLFVVELC
ncbi:hypothetical protein BDW60DRAFT_186393 [Aspergillus nidulans var. acristatus]